MTTESVNEILDNLEIPVSKIEIDLQMPQGTLAKAKKGIRELPEKWDSALCQYWYNNSTIKPNHLISIKENIANYKNWNTDKTKLVVQQDGLKELPLDKSWDKVRETMEKINKDFGAGTVMILGDKPIAKLEVISTGSLGLDIALGIGGLPRGRFVEITGPASSGKTTLALHIIAESQKKGLKCFLVDAENAFDAEYAKKIGVKVNHLMISQPEYAEQGLEAVDRHIVAGDVNVVVIDSIAALVPQGEREGEMGDSKMGLMARLMSQACRKMVASVAKTNTLLIFLNQIRYKIGGYGNPETQPGGEALKFYASVRLDVRRIADIKDGEESIGNRTKVKVVKSKCAPPFKTAEFDIIYGEGIDNHGEIVDVGSSLGIINKNGAWYSYKESKLGQGRDSVKQMLKDNPEMSKEIENLIINQLNNK